jgi:hypothetical protein
MEPNLIKFILKDQFHKYTYTHKDVRLTYQL